MDSRILLSDFEKALENLKEALAVPARTDLEKAGCIQYFEFCFELAWKSIQVVARQAGLTECNSPKACFRQAFAQRWIDEEVLWLEILSDRNRMAHTYSATDALQVYGSLSRYVPAFEGLLAALKAEFQEWPS
ncbi:MAG: HI0074 family nucleotidyltransferase substrate-binding subunit [Paracoccaceae bacterium]